MRSLRKTPACVAPGVGVQSRRPLPTWSGAPARLVPAEPAEFSSRGGKLSRSLTSSLYDIFYCSGTMIELDRRADVLPKPPWVCVVQRRSSRRFCCLPMSTCREEGNEQRAGTEVRPSFYGLEREREREREIKRGPACLYIWPGPEVGKKPWGQASTHHNPPPE